jgi:hypothetical protein
MVYFGLLKGKVTLGFHEYRKINATGKEIKSFKSAI